MKQWLSVFVLMAASFVFAFSLEAQERKTIDHVTAPRDLSVTLLSSNKLTPCVSCLSAAPNGEVYVGVDRIGSLGKGEGFGQIIKLIDADNDGVADSHTVFAKIDNPRGLMAVGNKVYVLHTQWSGKEFKGMFLSVLTDANKDGKADGPPKKLVSEISTRKFNQARGVDHTTNGIRMGIDGWIYIAIGDFGFVDATGTDGTKLTMYGGGIVRVRPDGTELETYVHGLRNIYDVAIDPKMNLFTRGNTNDGGGWNIRFIHEVQSGEYGYPKLFKRYTDETIPALVDLGGGSGTGSMFFAEPGWPAKYSNVPMMCDWGRGHLYIHRVTADGPSFTQNAEDFIKCSRITDVDVDGSGRLYLGSWHGSGFKGGTGGFVARVTPVGWKYKPFPDLNKADDRQLVAYLQSPSATMRLHAQQALLTRGASSARAAAILKVASNKTGSHESRVAAIFTLKQLMGEKAHRDLIALAKDPKVAEHALRALADRRTQLKNVPQELFFQGLQSTDPRVQVAAAVGLGRLGKKDSARALLKVASRPKPKALPRLLPVVAKPGAGAAKSTGKTFKSKKIKDRQTVSIDVDITGYKQLVLMVGDGGDGNGNDHGSWFEPILITKSGKKIRLTDLKWKSAKGGWGKTLVNKDCQAKKLARKDGKPVAFGIGSHSPSVIIYKKLPRDVVRFQAIGAISSNSRGGSVNFLVSDKPLKSIGPKGKASVPEGPHATPNPGIILPHVAVQALISLNAVDACLAAISTSDQDGALWALSYMHNAQAVDGLIRVLRSAKDPSTRQYVAATLVRLYNKERPYDGSHWWSTRPDTRGPYYYPTTWEASEKIKAALLDVSSKGDNQLRHVITTLAEKDRTDIKGLAVAKAVTQPTSPVQPTMDLEALKRKKGEISRMSIKAALAAVAKIKGDPVLGRKIFTQQGCTLCHSLKKDEPLKGPFMGQVGSILKRPQIAQSILQPNAQISQGFKTVVIQNSQGETLIGFVTKRLNDQIELRNITGQVFKINPKDVLSEKIIDRSMMPDGLVNGLSVRELASLVSFLEQQKK